MTDVTPVEPAVPPIWYSTQRALRTAFAFLITAVPIANALAAATIDYLRNQQDVPVPPWVFLVLNGILAVTTLIIGLVSKWMATPGFNELLTKIGLGSLPQKAIETHLVPAAEGRGVIQVTEIKPDPKVVG